MSEIALGCNGDPLRSRSRHPPGSRPRSDRGGWFQRSRRDFQIAASPGFPSAEDPLLFRPPVASISGGAEPRGRRFASCSRRDSPFGTPLVAVDVSAALAARARPVATSRADWEPAPRHAFWRCCPIGRYAPFGMALDRRRRAASVRVRGWARSAAVCTPGVGRAWLVTLAAGQLQQPRSPSSATSSSCRQRFSHGTSRPLRGWPVSRSVPQPKCDAGLCPRLVGLALCRRRWFQRTHVPSGTRRSLLRDLVWWIAALATAGASPTRAKRSAARCSRSWPLCSSCRPTARAIADRQHGQLRAWEAGCRATPLDRVRGRCSCLPGFACLAAASRD